jgi:hypothetical protein
LHFLVYFGVILGYIVFKERKTLDPKKISAIVEMPPLKNLKNIQIFNKMVQFYRFFIRIFSFIMAPLSQNPCTKPRGVDELKQAKIDVKTSTFLQFLLLLSMWCHFNGM